MIVFYEKTTGKIIGNIEGRVHGEDHLKMWIGDPDKTSRIVCNWVKDTDGTLKPEIPLFGKVEKSGRLSDYVVDIKTGELCKVDTI